MRWIVYLSNEKSCETRDNAFSFFVALPCSRPCHADHRSAGAEGCAVVLRRSGRRYSSLARKLAVIDQVFFGEDGRVTVVARDNRGGNRIEGGGFSIDGHRTSLRRESAWLLLPTPRAAPFALSQRRGDHDARAQPARFLFRSSAPRLVRARPKRSRPFPPSLRLCRSPAFHRPRPELFPALLPQPSPFRSQFSPRPLRPLHFFRRPPRLAPHQRAPTAEPPALSEPDRNPVFFHDRVASPPPSPSRLGNRFDVPPYRFPPPLWSVRLYSRSR